MNARKLLSRAIPLLVFGVVLHAVGAPRPRAAAAEPAITAEDVSAMDLDGTRILVRKADGSFASNEELVGAVLVARGEGGIENAYRIDAVELDPEDPRGERLLYAFSVKDPETGGWGPACAPDVKGVAKGFPLAGVWNARGEHLRAPGQFEIACTSGAYAKCVRMGYTPWKGDAMWDRHQACTRMVRADYCGDGTPHTRDGTLIDVYDLEGIQRDEPAPGMTFEAAWGKDGAVCVGKTRVPDAATLETLRAECPAKLGEALGAACTEEEAKRDPRTLVLNKS